MELRQLRYFARTAECLSFSEAARTLCITQSTLSQQVKQLEQELGVQLFQRNSHAVTLTEAGHELLPHALQTLQSAETCADRLRDLQQLRTGTLTIGVTYTFAPILTETVLTFMKRFPAIRLDIHYGTMEELLDELEHRKLDFLLSFKPTHSRPSIEPHILFDNFLAVIVADGHPLAAEPKVSLAQLARFDLALPARGLQARATFDSLTAATDRTFRVRIELNEVHILLRLVKESRLATILSESTVHGLAGLKAVPLDLDGSQMEGCVHVLKGAYQKASAREFVRLLCEGNAVRERISRWLHTGKSFLAPQ